MPRVCRRAQVLAAAAVVAVLAGLAPSAAAAAPVTATVPVGDACPAPAVSPALTGTFIDPNQLAASSAADAAAIANRLCGVGITEIVVQQTADLDAHTLGYAASTGSPAGFRQVGPDVVAAWSTALARHPGMHLHLGLGLSPSWFAASGSLSPSEFAAWLAPRRDADLTLARDITRRYGTTPAFRSTFAGWYLPDEIDAENFLTPGSTAVDGRAAVFGTNLLGPLTAALHALTPRALVSTAPFYQADVFTPAAWTALWRTILDASVAGVGNAGAVDVLAPQDGLGLGGGTAVASDLPAWFAASAQAISSSKAAGRTALWDDVETYRLDGDPVSHPATSGDLVQAMTAATQRSTVERFVAFTYAGNQLNHPAVDAAYSAYARGRSDTVAPTKPGSLAVTARPERTSVTLSWTAASDNGSGIAGYLLFRDGAYARRLDDPNVTSITDTELAPGTHRWQLSAFDGAGHESGRRTSSVVTIAPPAGTDVAAGARYWFPAGVPAPSYSDGCRPTSAPAACAGQLTAARAHTDSPSRTYPQTYQGYTGAIGDTTVVIDLGRPRAITDVTSHWLSYRSSSVRGPSTVTVAVSTDGTAWTTVATGTQPARPVNSGFWPYYVNADRQAFATTYASAVATTARYVRVTGVSPLGTSGWTMTDGIAVYGH